MAFALTSFRGSAGNLASIYGTFTSANGDNTASITHGFTKVAEGRVSLDAGGLNVPTPKITHSAGIATVVWDDTLGFSGTFYFSGK